MTRGSKFTGILQVQRRLLLAVFVILSVVLLSGGTDAQNSSNSNAPGSAAASPTPEPAPIPVSDIISQAEVVGGRLKAIRTLLDQRADASDIDDRLPSLTEEIEAAETQDLNTLHLNPTLEVIREIGSRWQVSTRQLADWNSMLQERSASLDRSISELNQILQSWRLTLASLQSSERPPDSGSGDPSAGSAPPEAVRRVNETIASIEETRREAQTQLTELLAKQSRVSELETRVTSVREEVRLTRTRMLANLSRRDSAPIWAPQGEISLQQLVSDGLASFSTQATELRLYASVRIERFVLHGIVFLLLAAGLYWARSRIHPFVEKEPKLEKAAQIFRLPIATALVLTILASGWMYPQAPALLSSLIGAAALVPVVFLLRRMVERPLFIILDALVVLYFVDRFRDILINQVLTVRLLFLAEMLGAILFLLWFLKSKRLSARVEAAHYRVFKTIRRVVPYAIAVFLFAFTAGILGFVRLAYLVGNGVLNSAYTALIFYTAVQIIRGLIIFALRVPPLSRTLIVKNNRPIIRERSVRIVRWAAAVMWLLITLNLFSVRQPIFMFLRDVLAWSATVGTVTFSFGSVVLFFLMVWIAILTSRFVRFVLEEDVYPRVGLGGGVSYAVSTMLHYSILVIGFLIAVGLVGVDFTKFALIAGAVGIGVGFGLQNIINNFVSGLILLVERPVKVDDTVQIGEHTGSLRQIGLRACVLRKVDGSDVIVPNSQLISEEVINWTMSDEKRRIDIPVGVAYGTDPRVIFELLNPIAVKHNDVLKDPPPKTFFQGFGESTLDFELRVWTSHTDGWQVLRSEIMTEMYAVLSAAGIELPSPQLDVNITSVAPATGEHLPAIGNKDAPGRP
jgi:potassium efflux system protein